jgi:predicted KAP-like P-loop ATPase
VRSPPCLPESEPALLERALTAADNIQNDRYKAKALSAIAPRLPESDQQAVLERALIAADNLQDAHSKAAALNAIIPCLLESEPALLKRSFTAAGNLPNDYLKAKALSALAPRLPESEPELLEHALTAADNLQADYLKAIALNAIAPRLPESDQQAVLECALIAADNIQHDHYKADKVKALTAIALRLPKSKPALLERALTAADDIQDDFFKALALSAIAPCLPKSDQQAVLERAITAVDNTQNDQSKAYALSEIIPRLPESDQQAVLERALTAADNLLDDQSKAYALSDIAPCLPESEPALLERVLTAADDIQGDHYKAQVLSAIAPRLPKAEQKAVLERALAAADNLQDEEYKAQALSAIAPRLPNSEPALLERTLAAADNLQDEYYKAQILSAIAPQISLRNLKVFLEATSSLSCVAGSLASPATRYTEDFLQLYPSSKYSTALSIVTDISDDADKTKFLSALIPRLAVGLLPNALRLIQETFTADRYRTETLNNLVPYLPADQTPEALDLITQFIKNPYYRTAALVELIPLLPIGYCDAVLKLLEAKIALPQHRASILQAIAKALTTPEQIDKLTSVTSKAYPEVAPTDEDFLSEYQHLVERVLNLTYQLKEPKRDDFSYERTASSIFSQLAPVLKHLAGPEQTAVLAAVTALSDPGYQAEVVIALAPHFKPFVYDNFFTPPTDDDYRNLLRIKIQLATTDSTNSQDLRPITDQLNDDKIPYIKSPYRNVEAWVELASHPAGKSHQTKALRAIQELQNNAYLQTQYLQRLIPYLVYQQRLEAVNIINDIGDPYHQVSARVALARKFPESEFFNPARDSALALESKVKQIEQLSTLAIDMPELIPRIIKLAKAAETLKNIERYGILAALAPHLPMRINREVKRSWALSNTITDDLWNRAFYLLARSYRDALTGGTLRNDAAQDKDLLDLKDEINALSGLLLMRDLEPPMTLGILGGWGGGKSYIMHLMQAQMTAIRSRKVDVDVEAWNANPNHEKLSPYVGHIYQIKFDAWTFAKSDLWASLMQTIFFELNRQISLEQQLARVLAENPEDSASRAKALCEAGQYWPVLYKASHQDRQWFLERVLSPAQLAKFKDIHNQGRVDDELWRQLGATYQAENQKLTELEAELHHKQDKLKNKKQDIRSQVDENKLNQLILKLTGPVSIILSNRISAPVLEQINSDITHQVKTQLGSQASTDVLESLDTEHLKAIIQTVAAGVFEHRYGEISFRSFLTWFQKNLRLFGLMLVFLALAILLPIAADALMDWLLPGIDNIFPRLIAFLAPLTPGIASAQALLKSSQKWVEETDLAVKEYEQQLETLPKQLEERREHLFQNQLEKVKEVATLEAEVQLLEEKVNAQRQRIPENIYESLEAFVSDRIQDGSYEKRLGLMQQVKGDLAELSNRLLPPPADSQEFQWKVEQLQKFFPRGPARVVVYIDDLDRCPPDRVVQVLEAVQLLVKTPLFIAVLAIDERYITRALEQFYKGVLLRHGSPSGTDYLEKIIQLPYRVRPIMANNLETYLRSQVTIQDNATGGTKFSEFSRQEFNLLLECCKQVDLSPRTLKRLTNVYKLFKIVCRTRGTKTTPQVQQAILALLALSGRYPNLMRGIFEDIQTCYEEQRNVANAQRLDQAKAKRRGIPVDQLERPSLHLETPLRDFVEHYQLPDSDRYLQLELDKLQHDALQTNILPTTLTLNDLSHEIFNLIRSFSFVGEIGEDPDDYRFSNQP